MNLSLWLVYELWLLERRKVHTDLARFSGFSLDPAGLLRNIAWIKLQSFLSTTVLEQYEIVIFLRLHLKCVVKWRMAKMYSIRPLQVLLYSNFPERTVTHPSTLYLLKYVSEACMTLHTYHYTGFVSWAHSRYFLQNSTVFSHPMRSRIDSCVQPLTLSSR